MKEIMIRELRDFLFHKPDEEWKMNEIHTFTRTSTYKPDDFGLRWNKLLPMLDVGTIHGLRDEMVLRLNSKHYKIALDNFNRSRPRRFLCEPQLSNYLLYRTDSSVTNDWIAERLKECHPEIILRWENSQQYVILSESKQF